MPFMAQRMQKIYVILAISVILVMVMWSMTSSRVSIAKLKLSFTGGTPAERVDNKTLIMIEKWRKRRDAWVAYAKERQCSVDVGYDRIAQDLAIFGFKKERSLFYNPSTKQLQKKTITREMLQRAAAVAHTHDFTFVNNAVKIKQIHNGGRNHDGMMNTFAHFIPNNTRMVINILDEPRLLPLPDDFIPLTTRSKKDLTRSNKMNVDVMRLLSRCNASEHVRAMRYRHGFYINPMSVEFVHEFVPIFSPTKIDGCLADITMPYIPYSNREVYIGEEHDVAWKDKKDEMVWRGSSTGGTAKGDRIDYWNFHRHR
jgi:hypothetical protein